MQRILRRTLLWCLGNPLLLDDGAGPALFSLLETDVPPHLDIVNCETTPENHLSPLKRKIAGSGEASRSLLLVADAAEMGLPGGSLRRMGLEQSGNISFSSHGIPLPLLLDPLLPRLDVVVLGIQPERRGFGEGLSPQVASSVQLLAGLLREERWTDIQRYQENCSPR